MLALIGKHNRLFLRKREQRNVFLNLLRYAAPYWHVYVALGLTVLASIANDLLLATFLMRLTDAAVAGDLSEVRRVIGLGVGLVALLALVSFAYPYLNVIATNAIQRDLRRDLFSHILRLPTRDYVAMHSGDLVSRLTNDVGGIGNAIGHNLVLILRHLIAALAAFVYLVKINWQMALLCSLVGPITLLVGRIFGQAMRRNNDSLHKILARVNAFLHDTFSGYVVVRAFALEGRFIQRYEQNTSQILTYEKRQAKLQGSLDATANVVALGTFHPHQRPWRGLRR